MLQANWVATVVNNASQLNRLTGMRISLDISLYPLHQDYKQPILDFIEALRQYDQLELRYNSLSTQLFGEFDEVWRALGEELPKAFGAQHTSVAVIKVVSVDVIE